MNILSLEDLCLESICLNLNLNSQLIKLLDNQIPPRIRKRIIWYSNQCLKQYSIDDIRFFYNDIVEFDEFYIRNINFKNITDFTFLNNQKLKLLEFNDFSGFEYIELSIMTYLETLKIVSCSANEILNVIKYCENLKSLYIVPSEICCSTEFELTKSIEKCCKTIKKIHLEKISFVTNSINSYFNQFLNNCYSLTYIHIEVICNECENFWINTIECLENFSHTLQYLFLFYFENEHLLNLYGNLIKKCSKLKEFILPSWSMANFSSIDNICNGLESSVDSLLAISIIGIPFNLNFFNDHSQRIGKFLEKCQNLEKVYSKAKCDNRPILTKLKSSSRSLKTLHMNFHSEMDKLNEISYSKSFMNFRNLEDLSLHFSPISRFDLRVLLEGLETCLNKLKRLEFIGFFYNEYFSEIGQLLEKCYCLTSFHLGPLKSFDKISFNSICQGLKSSNQSLQILKFSYLNNNQGNSLINLLETSPLLKKLEINSSNLGNSLEKIARSLKSHNNSQFTFQIKSSNLTNEQKLLIQNCLGNCNLLF